MSFCLRNLIAFHYYIRSITPIIPVSVLHIYIWTDQCIMAEIEELFSYFDIVDINLKNKE
jgi:hypothetical protein